MAWRLAHSLTKLRAQVNDAYPDRDKTSDGTIGDANHQGTASDHNPNAQGVVCALDLDHDPDNGFDGDKFLSAQLRNPHPNLKYIVFEGHIYSRKYAWKKRPSSGHYAHLHISVGVGFDGKSKQPYDDTTPWDIGKGSQPAPAPQPQGVPVTTFKTYHGNITTDKDGNGWTKIFHDGGKDPVIAIATLNGTNPEKEGYPSIGGAALPTASYDGNRVVVSLLGGKPNSGSGIKLLLGW